MSRVNCGRINWACNWTELGAYYNNNNNNSNSLRTQLLSLCKDTLTQLVSSMPYLPPDMASYWMATIQKTMITMPSFLVNKNGVNKSDIQSDNICTQWYTRTWWKWFERKSETKCIASYFQFYYNIDVNPDYESQLNNMINEITNIQNSIQQQVYNNCSNPLSLLNEQGLVNCGLRNQLNQQKLAMNPSMQATQSVMNSIQNNDSFPQYNLASGVNDNLNNVYSWDPMNTRSSFNSNYASLPNQWIQSQISNNNNWFPLQYNNCTNSSTLISLDNGTPNCLSSEYNTAIQQCSQAYQMSQVYQYGTDQLMQLWTDVSNSLPGNVLSTSKSILTNANDSCTKWVNMFNVWQEKENEAINTPCTPERPITSANDKVIEAMVNQWFNTSNAQLTNLNQRLNAAKQKLALLPNILTLNSENITNSPPGFPGTVAIRNNSGGGVNGLPGQYIEMTIPTGPQGDPGIPGVVGIQGNVGENGTTGKVGSTGIPLIPTYFAS